MSLSILAKGLPRKEEPFAFFLFFDENIQFTIFILYFCAIKS